MLSRPARRDQASRVTAAFVLLGSVSLLGIAAWLKPDPRGYGTHEQLHWGRYFTGPCGMMVVTGFPCPTCGMTTAFAHTVRLQWLRAARAQPAGFMLALGTIAAAVASGFALVWGRWPVRITAWLTPYRLFFGLLALLLGGWGYKLVSGLADGSLPVRWPR